MNITILRELAVMNLETLVAMGVVVALRILAIDLNSEGLGVV